MWDNTDVEKFVKSLIDTILDNAEDENIAWNWGEETLRVDYIINLINDLASMDYKRPYPKSRKCALCNNYYYRYKKSGHRNHCIGKQNGCDDYDSVFSFLKE